ncbi:MAG: hypothetical protein JNL32_01195 [Candidatus Kapabacteria bacterium]|nr:hypothetical protein [Candidatus Kapabacteria bacterium]
MRIKIELDGNVAKTTVTQSPKRGRPRTLSSQEARILEYLKAGNTITRMQAHTLFECAELPARIHALRKAGWDIISEPYVSNKGKHLVKYRLKIDFPNCEIPFPTSRTEGAIA